MGMASTATRMGLPSARQLKPDTSQGETARERSNAQQENTLLEELTSAQFVQRVQPVGKERRAALDALLVLPGVT